MEYFNINNNLKLNLNNINNDCKNNSNKFKIKLISKFKKRLDYEFNVLIVGEIFKSTNKHLLVGTADGKIRVYLNNEEIEVLETKGSSIQDLELLDTSKFGSIDVISGDSNGNLVIFSNHQILYRDTINGSITKIINHQLANSDFNLVVGDSLGFVTAIKPHQNTLWRFKIPTINQTLNSLSDTDILKINSHIDIDSILKNNNSNNNNNNNISDNSNNFKMYQQPSLHIRQIKSVQGYDIYNNKFHYILISENAPFLHIIDHGKRLCSIPTPSPVNCMCVGYFTNSIISNNSNNSNNKNNSNNSNQNNNNSTETPRNINHNHHHIHNHHNHSNSSDNSDKIDNSNSNDNNSSSNINISSNSNNIPTQVALGCENGYIYILTQDFKIEPYCQVGYPITLLNKIKYSEIENKSTIVNNNINNSHNNTNLNDNNCSNINNSNNNDIDDIDILICTGYFHSIKFYYNKDLICDHSLDDWVYTLSIGAVENNGDKTIVVGALDNSIEYLKPIIINN